MSTESPIVSSFPENQYLNQRTKFELITLMEEAVRLLMCFVQDTGNIPSSRGDHLHICHPPYCDDLSCYYKNAKTLIKEVNTNAQA